MGKFQLSKQSKQEIKEYASKMPSFPKVFQNGERKGQIIFNTRLDMIFGKKLISQGILKNKFGEKIDPNLKYRVEIPTTPQMVTPYEYLIKIIEQKGISEEILSQATKDYYELHKLTITLLTEHKAKQTGDQKS